MIQTMELYPTEFLNCLLRLYRCQETRASFCPNVERCRPEQDGPKTEAVVSDEVGGAGDPAFSAELGQGQLIEAQDGGSTDINGRKLLLVLL